VSCPHTNQQNGSTERKHRHIVEIGLSLLAHASMPGKFWDEAFLAATYLINRLPNKVIHDSTPLERLFDQKPDYSFLRIFGCACWPHLCPYNSHKLQFRSKQCVFLGYSSMYKGYKCLEVSTGRVYISRDVTFDEEVFPFSELNPNAGARLRCDVALLHPTLFRHDCGDITIHDHITDNPLDTNNVLEVTGEILRENGEQIGLILPGPILPEQDTGPILLEQDPVLILPEQHTDPTLPQDARSPTFIEKSNDDLRPTTRAQRGIHRPQVYTDDTIRYGKHGFLTQSGEPYSVDDALADTNWKMLCIWNTVL
jgi:hypothetical protein